MPPEDEKRVQREFGVYSATRGPNYAMLENDIGRAKAKKGKRDAAHAAVMRLRNGVGLSGDIKSRIQNEHGNDGFGNRETE